MAIKHAKVSIVSDGTNTNNVRPSDWNADHIGINVHDHTTIDTGGLVISSITGSSIMSGTAGSTVKHNVSGVTSGSYNQIQVDSYGHVTSASYIGVKESYFFF